jgi:ankyrin repeat protein
MAKVCREIADSKLSWEGMVDNFVKSADEAHQLRITQARNAVSPNFGRELALQALEYRPLGGPDAAIERLRNSGVALIAESLVGAAGEGDIELVMQLIEAGVAPNSRDRFGNLALVEAAWKGHDDVVTYLLDHGADVNGKTLAGLSPLSASVISQHFHISPLLLDRGADPNVLCPDGKTPLMTASWLGAFDTVKTLLLKGAKPNCRAEDGITALQAACAGNHTRVVQLLRAVWATE